MRRQTVCRACSNCSGDYENPDLTAPAIGEGDVENSAQDPAERANDRGSDVLDNTGDGGHFDARKTLSDVRGWTKPHPQ